MPEPLHRQLMGLLRIFLVTGGMPEAIKVYLNSNSWQDRRAGLFDKPRVGKVIFPKLDL